LYSVTFKLNVIHYEKEHRNRTAERHVGPSPKQKVMHE